MAIEQSVWLPALIGAGAALGTNVGERVLARLFDGYARQEAQRDYDVELIEKVVFEIRDLATGYWCTAGQDQKLEGSIVGRLTFVASLIDGLYKSHLDELRTMQMHMNRFDQACTSDDFGSVDRASNAGMCRDIETTAYNLVHTAMSSRRKMTTLRRLFNHTN